MFTSRIARFTATAATIAATASFGLAGAGTVLADGSDPHGGGAGNAIQVYRRAADGTLTAAEVVATGGLGAGNSLGSQGAIVIDGRHLLVVNAGDSTVSSFVIGRRGLELRDVESSGGTRPVSVTVHDDTVVVLNAGSDSISALHLNGRGDLRPIEGSTRSLSGSGVGGAQVQFADDGESVVVTEKTTSKIDVFEVDEGEIGEASVFDSAGAVPFGFDIDRRGHVVVSEAAPGALSSYRLRDGQLAVVTSSLPDTQRAACWVEISRDGRWAYTTNAASATVSSYRVARDGSLSLVAAVAATTGAGPTDIAQSDDGAFLYVRVGSGTVDAYAIGGDGSLTSIGQIAGATSVGTAGLAAV
jgi:6-phosphogluconolactonase (cycloisomerase 2 family)